MKIDAQYPIARNKVMVIDGETVITWPFNFSKAAEKNKESHEEGDTKKDQSEAEKERVRIIWLCCLPQ